MSNGSVSRVEDLPDYPALKQLLRALWSLGEGRGAAVMVGAGFSCTALRDAPDTPKPPLWPDFAKRMAMELGEGSSSDPLKLAEEYHAELGQPALDTLIRTLVPDAVWRPGTLHEKLLGLPWADVLTTNWDTLLERGQPSDPSRTYELVLTPADIPRARAPRIVKLHGSLPSGPFIFTAEDFRTYPRRYAPFVNLAQQVLLENDLCLIGFSGDDPNFLAWAGWVRDQLGASARRIRLLGVLNLSSARRKVFESHGVTPIDLGPLVDALNAEEQHGEAARLLIDTFWAARPAPSYDWVLASSEWSEAAPPGSIDEFQALVERWRDDRKRYPHWLVAPPDVRHRLRHATHWDYFKHKAAYEAATPALRAAYLVERVWRLETSLLGLDEWTMGAVSSILAPPPSEMTRPDQAFLFAALARQTRYDQDWPALEPLLARFEALAPSSSEAAYERALVARDRRDLAELKARLPAVKGDDPVWNLRRAALMVELEDFEGASEELGLALSELRHRRSRDRQSLALISREAWAAFLVGGVRHVGRIFAEVDDLKSAAYAEAKCDPEAHFRAADEVAESFATRRRAQENPIEARFDAGHYRDNRHTRHMDAVTPGLEVAAFLRLIDLVGLPTDVDNVSIGGYAVRRLLEEVTAPSAAELHVSARFLTDPEKGLIDRHFSRVAVARMPLDLVQALATDARAEADRAMAQVGETRRWTDAAAPKVELISRLVLRLPPEACLETFRWGLALMRRPRAADRLAHPLLTNLLRRTLEGVPPAMRSTLVLEALQAPMAHELAEPPASRGDWPDLPNLFAEVAIVRPLDTPAWDVRIGDLTKRACDPDPDRPIALHWLTLLHDAGALSDLETADFGAALWSLAPPQGLPHGTQMRAHAFLTLPAPSQTHAHFVFRAEVVDALAKGRISESNLTALHGAVLRGRGEFALEPAVALVILDALLAVKPKTIPKHDLFDETRRNNTAIEQILAPALADAVLPVLTGLDDARRDRLFAAVAAPDRPSLVLAVPELIRLAPERSSGWIALLRRGLSRQEMPLVAAVDGVMRFVAPNRSPGVELPPGLAGEVVALCEIRRDAGVYQALACALRLMTADALSTEQLERMAEVLAQLADETDYAFWSEADPRTRALTLIRACCVRLARMLDARGIKTGGVERWLDLAADDPAPEVRFAHLAIQP
jgi:hypothetical protein